MPDTFGMCTITVWIDIDIEKIDRAALSSAADKVTCPQWTCIEIRGFKTIDLWVATMKGHR